MPASRATPRFDSLRKGRRPLGPRSTRWETQASLATQISDPTLPGNQNLNPQWPVHASLQHHFSFKNRDGLSANLDYPIPTFA